MIPVMRLRTALLFVLALAGLPAAAQQAFANRATDLKDQASAESRTLAALPEGAELKVIARSGGWTRVEAAGKTGWVRAFHLRFPTTTATESSSGGLLSGLTSALGGRSRSQAAGIQTVGVRGLSPEELKNANPDAEALRRLQSYRADNSAAERFAREGRLAAMRVDYNEGSSR
jgi:hypothetical protein